MAALVPVVKLDDGRVTNPTGDPWRLSVTVDGFEDLSFKVRVRA